MRNEEEEDQYWASLALAEAATRTPEEMLSPVITGDPLWPKLKAARNQGASYDDLRNTLRGRNGDLVDALQGLEARGPELMPKTSIAEVPRARQNRPDFVQPPQTAMPQDLPASGPNFSPPMMAMAPVQMESPANPSGAMPASYTPDSPLAAPPNSDMSLAVGSAPPQQASLLPQATASLNRPASPEAYIADQQENEKKIAGIDAELAELYGDGPAAELSATDARIAKIDAEIAELGGSSGAAPPAAAGIEPSSQPPRAEAGMTSNDGTFVSVEDLKRGGAPQRFARGFSRPVQALSEAFLNSPIADNQEFKNLGITPESFDAQIADMNASSARGRKQIAEMSGGEGTVFDFIDTTIKGDGDWDVAGGFGQALAEVPLAVAAGPSFAAQVLAAATTGLLTPTDQAAADDFWGQKGAQAAFAAMVGAAGEGVQAAGGYVFNRLRLLVKGNPQLAAEALREHVGEESAADVIRLLEEDANASIPNNLSINASAGEVAAEAQNPKFAAMSDLVDDQFPEQAFAREVAQNAERNAPLDQFIEEGAEGAAIRSTKTTQLREESLDAADDLGNEAARLQAKLDEAVELNRRATDRPFSSDRTRQEKIMSAWDIERYTTKLSQFIDASVTPATTEKMFGGIKARLKDAEVIGSPEVKKMLSRVQAELKSMVDPKTGVIPSGALAAYRLTGLDTSIKAAMKKDGPLPRSVADDLIRVKSLLDETIEGSLGTTGGWKNYLDTFKELSIPVNKGDVASVLKKSNTNTAVNPSVDKGNPEALITALKTPERTLQQAKVLAQDFKQIFGDDLPILENLTADLERSGLQKSLAAQGRRAAEDVTTEKKIQLANPLIREIMLLNAMFSAMTKQRQADMTQELGKLFTRDPQLGYKALAKALRDGAPRGSTRAGRYLEKLSEIFITALPKTASQIGAANLVTPANYLRESLMTDEEE